MDALRISRYWRRIASIGGQILFAAALWGQDTPHFHHVHLNSTDSAAAIAFYTSKFDCERGRFNGRDAVWAQKSWLLFAKVDRPPAWELNSAIWHIGWGAEDMPAAYQRQVRSGTRFFTPLTDISGLAHVPGFYYAYVDGPDHALIEINTAPYHRFGHLHLFSADPVAAGEWYIRNFAAVRRGTGPPSREPRFYQGYQVGPSVSLLSDNVNIIIFPMEHARQANPDHWNGRRAFAPTRGRVIDHVAFSVEHLDAALDRLRRNGVPPLQPPATDGALRHAFVQGPDAVLVELVEGHAHKE